MIIHFPTLGARALRGCLQLSVTAALLLTSLSMRTTAQTTTINTQLMATSGYNNVTSAGSGGTAYITFVLYNNSGSDIKLKEVGRYVQTTNNNQPSTIYYSATSLSGSPGTLPNGWTQIHTATVTGITASGIAKVNDNINFIIPSGATYRFALQIGGTNYYSSSGAPNSFTAGGVTMYCGNYQIGGANVGYGSTNTPRYFRGYVTFEPANQAPNNAGVVDVTSPSGGFCTGSYPVKVLVKNTGTSTLNNVTVQWRLDGTLQGNVVYNTPIPVGQTAEVTLHNSINFGIAARTIKAWTILPNGVTDPVNTDDTTEVTVRASLSGTYTVGSGGDFPTVADAANALNQYGICAPVTMNILPGTYTGQVKLDSITGTSASRRVTFQSQSGDPTSVVVNAAPTGTGYVWQMNNSSFVTIKNITVESSTSNAGRVIEYVGSSSSDSLINCTINSTGTTSSSNSSGIFADELTGTKNVFLNNNINRGYYAIFWSGTSTAILTSDHVFDGNKITDAYLYSHYFYYTNNLKVRNEVVRAIN